MEGRFEGARVEADGARRDGPLGGARELAGRPRRVDAVEGGGRRFVVFDGFGGARMVDSRGVGRDGGGMSEGAGSFPLEMGLREGGGIDLAV